MVLVDIDDVLLDWIGGFEAFIKSKGITTKTARPMNWDLGKWIEHDSVTDLVTEFNASPLFARLNTVDGAVAAITVLAEKHKIIAITCCGDSDAIRRMRAENIESHFGSRISGIHCLALGEDKAPLLQAYDSGAFWVEDKWENAVCGADAGHKAILLDKPYNGAQKEDPRVKRLYRWCDIVDHIKENS